MAAAAAAYRFSQAGVPARHHARARRLVPGARVPAAFHRRLPPEDVAGRRAASGSARQVSGRRHPQPHRSDAADNRQLVKEMDALNIRVLNNLSGGFGDALKQRVDYIRSTPYEDRFTRVCNGLNFNDVAPGYGQKAAAQLEADVKNGAIGLKIFKETGMDTKKADGSRSEDQRPRAGPLWEAAGRLNIPVIIHTGEPPEFFKPLDSAQRAVARAGALSRSPPLSACRSRSKSSSAERDDLFRKHPKTRFIVAHFGWHANNLGRAREAARRVSERRSRARRRFSTTSDASRARRTTFSSSTRTGFSSARTRTRRRSFRTTGGCSRPRTSTSTTTATITRSGSCTGWVCRTACCGRCTTRTPCA